MTNTQTKTQSTWTDAPLEYLISARKRLTPDERKLLKTRYYELRNAGNETHRRGTGGLSVETSFGGTTTLNQQLGMSDLVFADLVNSRDSISLNIILKLQQTLGIELVQPQDIMNACESYVAYVFGKVEDDSK